MAQERATGFPVRAGFGNVAAVSGISRYGGAPNQEEGSPRRHLQTRVGRREATSPGFGTAGPGRRQSGLLRLCWPQSLRLGLQAGAEVVPSVLSQAGRVSLPSPLTSGGLRKHMFALVELAWPTVEANALALAGAGRRGRGPGRWGVAVKSGDSNLIIS
jgi:hypothetical protein